MQIEFVTKSDIQVIENRIQEVLNLVKSPNYGLASTVYTTKELAVRLKVSTKTINNWREARIIEFCKVQGVILFTEKAVTEFLANHSIKRRNALLTSKSTSHE